MSYFATIVQRGPVLLLFTVGLGGALLVGCSSSESTTAVQKEPEMAQEELASGLQGVNQALAEDSTDTDAYLRKAELLRVKADSTMKAARYVTLHRQAWEAESTALAIDADVREDVQEQRRRTYTLEMRRGEDAYNRGSKDEDETFFRQSIGYFGAAATTLRDSARPALNEAYARLRVEQETEVIPVLEEYVRRADTTAEAEAYAILGQLYVSTRQYEAATKLLDRGTAQYPGNDQLQALRLNAYNQAGDVDEALAVYREQIDKKPKRATYRYNYGALLLQARRYGPAVDQLSRAIELQPDNAEGQYNLGAAYLNAALAREDSIAALKKNPASQTDTTMSVDEQIDRLTERRDSLLESSIAPLERAREITEQDQILRRPEDDDIRRDACRALLVAYVKTDRPGRAAQVEDCTEFAQRQR
jgi:tetratricopeptide (TPR) repeat protein